MSSSDVKGDISSDDKSPQKHQKRSALQQPDHSHQFRPQNSGMTPSIITTINNTSPTLPANYPSHNNNNHNVTKAKRNSEPYESYIEDSFVGHWEHEDEDEYPEDYADESRQSEHQDNETGLQHPSTIEFDFDSFGPESFIYTPPSSSSSPLTTNLNTTPTITSSTISATQVPATLPALDEVSPELESQQEEQQHKSSDEPLHAQQASANIPEISSAINTSTLDHLVDTAQIDYKVIEPYKKVISHAGYCHHSDPSASPHNPGEQAPAIIVFSACYLPDRSRRDYDYVMDHLFLYVLSSLHELIADDYILIYLHNTQPYNQSTTRSVSTNTDSAGSSSANIDRNQRQNNLPTFNWMKRCYQMIDRKLRKNLKILYLVKPTFWLKTIVIMCKPFISAKFSKKLRFVENMDGLKKCLPVDKLTLPASAENI